MRVVVIGGGIVGSSAAYRLARAGAEVVLVDRVDQGQATAAGAGIIAPGASLRSDAFQSISAAAVSFYPELLAQLAEDGETETGYAEVGALLVATTEAEAERLPELAEVATRRAAEGVRNIGEVRPVDAREARELFPPLAEVVAGVYQSGAARMNGRLMRAALRAAAEKRGARLVTGSARPVLDGRRVTAVELDGETLAVDAVLLAAGAWTAELGRELGVRIPVEPQRGQILHLDLPEQRTGGWPILEGFHSHYILTFPEHRVVAGATRETGSGFDYRMTAGGVYEALGEALRIAPGLAPATLAEIRIGFRPASPDQLPILGPAPGLENVFVATGHGPSGLQLGPYSGAAVADQALGRPVALDLSPFSVARFVAA